ncbi:MAG: mechanosensitive ion channel family protein [Saprospiraceae bacterium]|nr:mechanosensitive ion channel family protein [Saprospiraceae bacterium]
MLNTIKFVFKLLVLCLLIIFQKSIFNGYTYPEYISTNLVVKIYYFAIFWLSINLVIRTIQFFYRKRKKYGIKFSDNVIVGLQNIYYILVFSGLGITLLGFAGVELKELVTALSIVAASIAIITKEIALDILCGIQFSFSKEIAIGDYVKIGEQQGEVLDINITKIILLNENDDIIYIPNSKAYYAEMINYTQKELRKYNVEFAISPQLSLSLEQFRKLVDKVLLEYIDYLDDEEINLKITGIKNHEIGYKVQFKLNQVNPRMANEIKSKIMNLIITQVHGSA